MSESKDPAAVSLGTRGGKAGKGAAKRRPAEHYKRMVEVRQKRAEMSFSLDEIIDAITPEGRGKRLEITTTNGDGPKKTTVMVPKPPREKP